MHIATKLKRTYEWNWKRKKRKSNDGVRKERENEGTIDGGETSDTLSLAQELFLAGQTDSQLGIAQDRTRTELTSMCPSGERKAAGTVDLFSFASAVSRVGG
jgi:hypothetical protein